MIRNFTLNKFTLIALKLTGTFTLKFVILFQSLETSNDAIPNDANQAHKAHWITLRNLSILGRRRLETGDITPFYHWDKCHLHFKRLSALASTENMYAIYYNEAH